MRCPAGRPLPTGTVTLLLGDVEGSTRAWDSTPDAMADAMAHLRDVIEGAVADHGGVCPVEQGEGDSFVAAFACCSDAVRCALTLACRTEATLTRLRLGVHTGEVRLRDEGNYMGPAINRAARIRDAGHGGQVLLSQTAADLAFDDLAPGASLVDLGTHRLRDLDRPEHIWQLAHPGLSDVRRPLRTAGQERTNLLARLTSFVGRQDEMEALRHLLDDARVVTLTGAGGCGKTRLAVEIASSQLSSYPGGAWFADLSATNAIDGVEPTVAGALGVVLQGGSAADAIARAVGTDQTLLVLDNCEHLIGACAELAERLLRCCAGLVILATSREPLGLDGEITFRVPSLALPREDGSSFLKAAQLEQFAAVQLFVERARRARPGFVLDDASAGPVLDICRRLDGIPLALELAAARLRVLSPTQVREGLHDRFRLLTGGARTAMPRQQTLQASVEWSYDLLLEPERLVLNRLSVFAGGFDLAAAEAVCTGAPIEAHHIFDLLSQLVDKSLVLVREPEGSGVDRFWLLETVRSYGAARLIESGEAAAVRVRHYEWCMALADQRDGDETAYRTRVIADYDNIRRALQWAEGQEDPVPLARLASRLYLFWATGRLMVEGAGWFDKVVAREADPSRLPHVVARLALLLSMSGDYDRAMYEGRRAVELTRALDNPSLLAWTLLYLAQSLPDQGAQVEAVSEALELAEKACDTLAQAWALSQQGWQRQETDPLRALGPLEASIHIARQHGYGWIERMSEATLAITNIRLVSIADALERVERATASLEEAGEGTLLGTMYAWLAICREMSGDVVGADSALEHLDHFDDAVNVAGSIYRRQAAHAWVSMYRGRWLEARDRLHHIVDLSVDDSMHANTMVMLGWCEAMCGDPQRAGDFAQRATTLAERSGSTASSPLAPPAHVRALAARRANDLTAAEASARVALQQVEARPVPPWVRIAPMNLLGAVLVAAERADDGVRLLGAADAERRRSGIALAPLVLGDIGGQDEAARLALGDERFEERWQEGAAMSWREAVAYAQRGRGERRRPKLGWASLTPTERQVVDLAASGATNVEIAGRLFMAIPTVKTHLTHVYAKLGLTSRAQLAAAAAALVER